MKKLIRSKWFLGLITLVIALTLFANYKLTYKGKIEHVTFHSDIELEGILVRPNTPGPHPVIILLHGSGGSYQTYNKWYNRLHGNAFLKRGFAILAYTKRGSGKNNVDYRYFTYKDLMNDGVSAVKFVREQPNIDQNRVGLMGVSESGWFTPEIAAVDGNIAFIINRVSSPFQVTRTIMHEWKLDALAEGFTQQEVEKEIIPFTTRIRQYYIDVVKDSSLVYGPERIAINKKLAAMHQDKRFKKWFISDRLTDYDPKLYTARASNYAYDPLPYLQAIDVPLLYIMGGKDVNMPTSDIVDFLKKFREEEGKRIDIKVYPKAGHYLYRWKYLGIEGLYQEGYLALLADWALEQVY